MTSETFIVLGKKSIEEGRIPICMDCNRPMLEIEKNVFQCQEDDPI